MDKKYVLFFISMLGACSAADVPLGARTDGMPTYQDFKLRIGKLPYRATPERSRKIVDGARALRECAPKKEVLEKMGTPDYSQSEFGPKGPNEKWLGFQWRYLLTLQSEGLVGQQVEVFFDVNDHAQWIAASGVDGVRELGGPGKMCVDGLR